MKNKNILYHYSIRSSLFQIKKFKFWIGIIIFIVQSIALYSFCNILLDMVRMLFYGSRDFYILSGIERIYFNLIFANFALINGFHTIIKWGITPSFSNNISKQGFIKKSRIEYLYFPDIFYYIVFALLIFYGRMIIIMPRWFFDITTDGFNWIFAFLIEISYFLSIFLIFSKQKIKFRMFYIAGSFILITILALGLAHFNVINYKKWDDLFLKEYPQYNCNLKIPDSHVFDDYSFYSYNELKPIYFYINKNRTEELIFNHYIIPLSQLSDSIEKYSQKNDLPLAKITLYMDTRMSWEQYQRLCIQLYKNHIQCIRFIIDENSWNWNPYNNEIEKVIHYRIPNYLFTSQNKLTLERYLEKISNIIRVDLINNIEYQVNDRSVSLDSLKWVIKEQILKDTNYLIYYKFNKNVNFGNYFRLIPICKEALYEINTNQVIDPRNSEVYLYPNADKVIPFLFLEEVTK